MFSEFPLFIFTSFAGVGIGFYTAYAFFPNEDKKERPWLKTLITLILLAIGLLGCLGHLGRPWLFLNALSNPTAGITQEAYFSIAFGIVLVIDLAFSFFKKDTPCAVRAIGAVISIMLATVMGFAYTSALHVTAWTTWVTVPFFVFGDLAMGFSLYAAMEPKTYGNKVFFVLNLVVEFLAALSLVGEMMHFASVGESMIPFVAGLVLAPCVSIVGSCFARKSERSWTAIVVCACVILGIVASRLAFYLAA